MNAPPVAASEQPSRSQPGTLHRSASSPVYVVLMLLVVAAMGLTVLSIPLRFGMLRAVCATDPCATGPFSGQTGRLGPDGVRQLAAHGLSLDGYAAVVTAIELLWPAVAFTLAAVLVRRKADDRMAQFVALASLSSGLSTTLDRLAMVWPHWARVTAVSHALGGSVMQFLLLALFPDGHFMPRWTRWVALVALVWQFPPLLVPTAAFSRATLSPASQLVWVGIGVFAQLYRYRRAGSSVQRRQTKWVVFGFAASFLALMALNVPLVALPPSTLGDPLVALAQRAWLILALALPFVALFVALLRHRLFDIDVVISRTLVYAALTVSIVAVYAAVVGGLGALLAGRGTPALSLLAAGLVALLFQPLHMRLQRGVNRLLYGERDNPYAVLAHLDRQLEGTVAAEAILPTVVQTIVEALRLPYAAIALHDASDGHVVAECGAAVKRTISFPLPYQGEVVGELRIAPRAGEDFGAADRRLLADLARHAGIAAQAVRLTDDLQRSRERLVTAREEERRRLRRDLHDGLGPQLAGVTLRLDAARNLLHRDPAAADALLAELAARTQEAVADIRRLVYALRPPALDDLGLVAALRQQAQQYDRALAITVDAPDALPALPAAVEVAAYRIVQEAMTNAVCHAEACACVVRIRRVAADALLAIEVCDDGRGIPPAHRPGVGLRSMRERAEELGGTCTIENPADGGTRVQVCLPYDAPGPRQEPIAVPQAGTSGSSA